MKTLSNVNENPIGTPEAFYNLFRTLSQDERLAAASYILEDEEIRHYLKIHSNATLKALPENKQDMPTFDAIDQLREDIVMGIFKFGILKQK